MCGPHFFWVQLSSYFWRYSRQIALGDIGSEGQEKLRDSSVVVVGLGGLGSQVAMSLAASGVGRLRLVDFDVVSIADLHRQLVYCEDDVGLAKAEAAARRVSKMNGGIVVEPFCEYLSEENAASVVGDVDLVVDCTDSFGAKYVLNRACARLRKPLVFGSAIQEYGNVALFEPWGEVCLECLYPGLRDEDYPTCAVAGVLPQCVQVVGSIEAAEAIRWLIGSPSLLNTLLFVDMKSYALDKVGLRPNPACPNRLGLPLSRGVSEGPQEVCSRNGMLQLLMVLGGGPTVAEAYEKLRPLGDAEFRGRFAVEVRRGGAKYTYTAAGVVLAEVDAQTAVEEAKRRMQELAERLVS